MAKSKITKRYLDNLTPSPGENLFIRDTELRGFGVRVNPQGSVSFVVEARIRGGSPKRRVLGQYPLLSVEQARSRAIDLLAKFREGIDPVEAVREEAAEKEREQALEVSLAQAIEDFFRVRGENLRPKTLRDYRNTLHVCFSDWMEQPARALGRQDIALRHKDIGERGRYQANKSMRILRSVLEFARSYYEVDGKRIFPQGNPVDVLSETKAKYRETPRSRYIHQEDLFRFVRGVMALGHDDPSCTGASVRDYLLLLLCTGLRSNEALGLCWADVDFDRAVFTVVAEHAKNRERHEVPMSTLVYSMLHWRRHQNGTAEHVFPGNGATGHMVEPRKQIAKVIEHTGIEFTPHDLRRTFATILNELDTNPYAIKRLMNHKSKTVTENYIQTKAESYRKHLEQVAIYIEAGHNWASDAGEQEYFESASSNIYRTTCGLQRLLYHKTLPEAESEMLVRYVTDYRAKSLP